MIFWLDAQLSPRIAYWLSDKFGIQAIPVRNLGLRDASDQEIFMAARAADVVVVTNERAMLRPPATISIYDARGGQQYRDACNETPETGLMLKMVVWR